jgi:transposase-like protein
MDISQVKKECPDCHNMNTVKYNGVFCGIIYGCPECGNTFTDKGYTVYSTGQDFLDAMDEIIAHNETHSG